MRCRTLLVTLGLATLLQFGVHATVVAAQQAPPAAGSDGQPHLFHTLDWYERQRTGGGGNPAGANIIFSPTDNLPPGPGSFFPGTVMRSTKVFLIFWTPNNTISATYKNLITRFVNDLKGTPFLNIVTQYYDNSIFGPDFIHNDVTLGGTFTDTSTAYPHTGAASPWDPLQDSDIQNEVDHAISVNGWPTGNGNFFAVFTEKGINSCSGSDCTPDDPNPNPNGFCAYHNWFNLLNNRIYTNMPFVNTWPGSCNNTSGTPNNADADREISTFSHELFEAITDPFPNLTWTDGNCGGMVKCGEIGDKCAYFFPNTGSNPNGDGSNLTLHGNPYNAQPEWSNATFTVLGGHANDGCTHAYLRADMDISKTGPGTVYAGANFDYTISVRSNGSPTAETPHFTDALNSNLKFVAITTPTGWACTTPSVGSSGNVDCGRTNNSAGTDGSMDSGDTATFALTSRVDPSTPNGTTVSNTGGIAWDSNYAVDNDTATNVHPSKTDSTSATVLTLADLTISKSTEGTAYAGLDFSYNIDVENNGPSDAQNVVMTDTLPAGTTFKSVTGSGGFICSGTGPVSCSKSTMGAGAIASITLTVHIPSSVPNGTIITNSAGVTSTTTDPNPSNNTASVDAFVNAQADLSVTKTGPTAPTAGTDVTYTVIATNLGPSDAQNASVNDTVTTPATFVSISGPASWPCSTPPVGGTGPITCTKATFPAGASPTFTLVVHVSPSASAGTQLCDTATVSSTTTDPVGSNNASTACGTVQTSADLVLAQTATTAGSPGNGVATFALTVTNNGPSDSQNISLVANSSLFTGPPPGLNASAGGTCTIMGSNVTCTWASLAFGASDTLTISVRWRSAVGDVCDSATVSAGTPDPNSINNNSTVCVSKK